jgi:hypothetical protein
MVLYSIIKPYNSFFVINRHIRQENSITFDDVFHRDIEALDDNVSWIKLLKELTDSQNKLIKVSKFLLSLMKFIMRVSMVNGAHSLQFY